LLIYIRILVRYSQHLRPDHRLEPELVAAEQGGRTAARTSGLGGRAAGQRGSHYVPGGHRLVAVVGRLRRPRRTVRAHGNWRVRVHLRRRTSVLVPVPHLLRVRGPRLPRIRMRIAGGGRARVHHDAQRGRRGIVPKRVHHCRDIMNESR
jgi:hypothetical protein